MRKKQLNILPTRDTTVGHWLFRGGLTDESDQGNDLTGQNIVAGAYLDGYSEDGLTAIKADSQDSPARKAFIPAASAGDFDFGTQSFTIEIIVRDAAATPGTMLLQKFSPSPYTGYGLIVVGTPEGHFRCDIGDGTNSAYLESTIDMVPGQWHYCAAVINREDDTLSLYQDGVPAGSVSIASVTGNLSNVGQDLTIQTTNNETYIDEVCISAEALTAAAITERAAGTFDEVAPGPDNFLLNYLPPINHMNADLQQFLIPSTRQHLELRDAGMNTADLIAWDRVPERFLTHLASLFGFELIDIPFATEAERRNFLPWIAWIYRRKGTIAALSKIIELLGFTANIDQVFPDAVPFIVNFHRCWSRDEVKQFELTDGFISLGNWYPPLAYNSRWDVVSGKLRGIGNGSDSVLNAITTSSGLSVYRIEVKYAVISGLSSPDKLGFYLKWIDADNYIAFVLNLTTSDDTLDIERRESGVLTSTTMATVSDVLPSSAYRTGEHRLWLFVNRVGSFSIYTGGIDDRTLFYNGLISMANPTATKKGLIVNKALTVDWDDFNLQVLNDSQSARIWTDAFLSRTVQITLSGSPAFALAKTNYLKQVLTEYVPAGTELEFL